MRHGVHTHSSHAGGNSLALYAVVGGLLGARLWEVLFFQWDDYSRHPGEVLAIWEGGVSIQGALVGGWAAALWYARRHKLDFWELSDVVAPALVFGQGIGRIACLLNGDAYGSPTGSGFGLVYPPGTAAYAAYGSQLFGVRHPVLGGPVFLGVFARRFAAVPV